MKKMLLRVNSGSVRQGPHGPDQSGVAAPCTTMRLAVTLTDAEPILHNGHTLVTVEDSLGYLHVVDEWFLDKIG